MDIDIDEKTLDNILKLISFLKNNGFRNTQQIFERVGKKEEHNNYYLYFTRNYKIDELHFRCIFVISKKDPTKIFIYFIKKIDKLFQKKIVETKQLNNINNNKKFKTILGNIISIFLYGYENKQN